MTVVYRGNGAWGTGKGSNLTAAEVDGNFWDHEVRIDAVETAAPSPNEISSITLVGSQLTVTMDDASTFGPFTVPTALFTWRGAWEDATAYSELDLLYVLGEGMFMVLIDHTSAAPFDAGLLDGGDPVYHLLFGIPSLSNSRGFFQKLTPTADEIVFQHTFSRALYLAEDQGGWYADCITRPTSQDHFLIQKSLKRQYGQLTFVDTGGDDTIELNANFPIGVIAGMYIEVYDGTNAGIYLIDSHVSESDLLTLDTAETLTDDVDSSYFRIFGTVGEFYYNGNTGQFIAQTADEVLFKATDTIEIIAPTTPDATLDGFSLTMTFYENPGE